MNDEGCREHDKAWATLDVDKDAADYQFMKSQFTWWNPLTWIRAPLAYFAVNKTSSGKKAFATAQKEAQDKA